MIPADLLDQLREQDQELWILYTNNDFVGEVSKAWLQHCLQEAIRARGWDFKIEKYHNSIWGMIRIPNECWTDEVFKHKADTEAEALMRAYLSALSGERI